jgi:hypothetical protein
LSSATDEKEVNMKGVSMIGLVTAVVCLALGARAGAKVDAVA